MHTRDTLDDLLEVEARAANLELEAELADDTGNPGRAAVLRDLAAALRQTIRQKVRAAG